MLIAESSLRGTVSSGWARFGSAYRGGAMLAGVASSTLKILRSGGSLNMPLARYLRSKSTARSTRYSGRRAMRGGTAKPPTISSSASKAAALSLTSCGFAT
jgi:hypothetical protein